MNLIRWVVLPFIVLILPTLPLYSQNYDLKGTVFNSVTKEKLSFIPIGIKELPKKHTVSDDNGMYSISLPKGK